LGKTLCQVDPKTDEEVQSCWQFFPSQEIKKEQFPFSFSFTSENQVHHIKVEKEQKCFQQEENLWNS